MSLIRKHGAVLQAWACLALVLTHGVVFAMLHIMRFVLKMLYVHCTKQPGNYHSTLKIIVLFCAFVFFSTEETFSKQTYI